MPAGESGSEAVRLLFRDLCWLATQPESPERDHIVEVLSCLLRASGGSLRGIGPAPLAILDGMWDEALEFLDDGRQRPPADPRVVSVGGCAFVNTEGLKPPPSLVDVQSMVDPVPLDGWPVGDFSWLKSIGSASDKVCMACRPTAKDIPLVLNLGEMLKDGPPASFVCQKARTGTGPDLPLGDQFRTEYFGKEESQERRAAREAAYRAVESYYLQTELYDRSVCTGGIGPDGGAMPRAGTGERGRIERKARHLFFEMLTAISSTGYPFTDAEIRAIMSDVCHNGEWRKKIESIPPGETPEKE